MSTLVYTRFEVGRLRLPLGITIAIHKNSVKVMPSFTGMTSGGAAPKNI